MSKKNNTLENLLQDLDRTKRREKICKKNLNESINNVIGALQVGITNIKNDNVMEENNFKKEDTHQIKEKLNDLSSSILKMQPLDNILNNHKEYFAYISKFGKDIDKSFNKDINNIFTKAQLEPSLINNVIHEHYLRDGKSDIHETLKKETLIEDDANVEKNFYSLQAILQETKKKNLEPALEWALRHEAQLEEIESDLLFIIYQQKFIQEMDNKGREKAIFFARETFPRFFQKYAPEIQRLMGSLLFDKDSENTRYADLYEDERWEEIAAELAFDACKIYKTTSESALELITNAGTIALPKFLKYYSLAIQNNIEWKEEDEIPVAIELGKEYQFHSIFVCPVTKDISTHDNPPMLLRCGHAISELAVKRLAGTRPRFKCPYCPVEQTLAQTKRLYFN